MATKSASLNKTRNLPAEGPGTGIEPYEVIDETLLVLARPAGGLPAIMAGFSGGGGAGGWLPTKSPLPGAAPLGAGCGGDEAEDQGLENAGG